MKRKIMLTLYFKAFLVLAARGQFLSAPEANTGYVITHFDSIYGKIAINLSGNSVLIKDQKGYKNLHADHIRKVVAFDQNGILRIYYGAHFGINLTNLLFETLVDGEFPLLYRQGVKFDPYADVEFSPYFTYKDGQAISLGQKKEITAAFRERQNDVQNYLKQNKLKLKEEEELIELFCFVNGVDFMDNSLVADEN